MRINHSDRELLLVCLAKGLRTFGFGSVSVILALFLAKHNFSSLEVGAIFSATLIEDAIFTTVVSLYANQLGMQKVLFWSSLLMIVSAACLCLATQPWLIALAAVCGIFSPAGFEGGPFAAVEQSIIARDVSSERLTSAFSWYNLTGFAGAALGSLLAGICFAQFQAFNHESAYQIIFMLYIASGIAMASLYAMLPKNLLQHKATYKPASTAKVDFGAVLAKKNAGALVLLQGLDAFGGGFVVQSLIAYWFYMRYHVGADFTGVIFCLANILAAGSFLAAPFIANRIGLLKTMVYTHLPCSIALCFVPFMPTAQLAAALLLSRSFFSSMDIPARQAYTMLLVHPDDRPAVAGLTTASRAIAQGLSPLLSGWVTASAVSGAPFVIAGVCKTVYDICLYATFRKIPLEGGTVRATRKDTDRRSHPTAR
ncbi:MAG: MFS transporter [Cyanobacteria bacterium SZAS-4]|nr:MFS transporter [Cyanobacteria bacterium SZAS-4]